MLYYYFHAKSSVNPIIAAFYLIAKVEEAADKPIYRWTHHIVSGHTLKHLCAAMVPVFLILMLAKRTVDLERYFSKVTFILCILFLRKMVNLLAIPCMQAKFARYMEGFLVPV